MKLIYTHRSAENASYVYYANVILDEFALLDGKPSYFWFGDCDNDVDGSPYWNQDPSGQPNTSLKYEGKSLNGDEVKFIVVPHQIINMTPEIVMGCMADIQWNGPPIRCVVGDSGPKSKIGEASPAALRAIGAPAPHNGNGGIDLQEVLFRIWPGVPAVVEGKEYRLQPA